MQAAIRVIKAFLEDRRGSIILIAGVAMSLMIGVGGAAYDFGIQQMALKNGQFAADLAATSGSAAKLHEKLDQQGGYAEQEDRVRMYYRLNARGFNVDPNFTPRVSILETPDAFITRIEGKSRVNTSFLGVLGLPTLEYTVETETNLRNPGDPVTYDLVLMLDYTDSMKDNEIEPGVSRLQALQQASTYLVNTVLCGDESGEECEDNNNRASIIPYALTVIGLDECDLPNAPTYCLCRPPRGVDPNDFELPDFCLPPCEQEGAQDPTSPNFMHCPCVPPENRSQPTDIVVGVYPFIDLEDQSEPRHSYAMRCDRSCLDGGCCPPKCRAPGTPQTTDDQCLGYEQGTLGCAQCQLDGYNRSFRGQGPANVPCCPDASVAQTMPGDYGWELQFGPLPPQTVACHRGLCTRSCTATGQGHDPCVENPSLCEDPCDVPNPPPGCHTNDPNRPNLPPLGFNNHVAPKTFYAGGKSAADEGATPVFSAIYNLAENAQRFGDPKLIQVQNASGGLWAITHEECRDEGRDACFRRLNEAIANDYTEGNTNSAAGFDALLRARTYIPVMRPNAQEPEQAVRVVVWVSDGENNRFQFPPEYNEQQPRIIPQAEFVDGAWQRVPEDLDEIVKNRYDSDGNFRVNPGEGRTAQEWSDRSTLSSCLQLRNFRQAGEPYPIIIYAVAVGEVGNLNTDEGRHTAALMNECVYGQPGAGLETQTPPIDPATGQPLQKRFFAVQSVEELNNAFRTIAGTIDRIRITD